MIEGHKILAIVIARGGSKGIKLKNLKKIGKKSLIQITAEFCKKLKFLDLAVVSTDHIKIAKESKKYGLSVPFKRPKNISGDFVKDEQVLLHALKFLEKKNKEQYDIILSLPPTSPFRNKNDINKGIKLLIKKKFDSVWTVTKNDSKNHPYKQLIIKNSQLKYFDNKGKKIFCRQQLSDVYYRNGASYIISRKCLLKNKLITNNSGAVISSGFQISIDNSEDLKLAEKYIKKKIKI